MIKHWSRVLNNIVTGAMSCDDNYFDTFTDTEPGTWIETNPYMKLGVNTEGGSNLRINYGTVGMIYNQEMDSFIFPQPKGIDGNIYSSWSLDLDTGVWNPPIDMPTDGSQYTWDEETTNWIEVTGET